MEKPYFKSEVVYDCMGNALMRVSYEGDDGIVTEKNVTMDTYLSIIKDATYSNLSSMVRIGRLPKGYVDGLISADSKNTFSVVVAVPAEKRALSFGHKHWYIPYPGLIFLFTVLHGELQKKSCFAYIDKQVTESTKLYQYPFGNVSEMGSICMGSMTIQNLTDMCDVESIIDDFFFSETNNDYYSKKNHTGMKQEELLKRLSKLDTFPEEWLTPNSSKCFMVKDLLH